jgi:hypothetical protein
VIFVDQNHRNLGIGTELARFALEKFGHLGFELVWLTVRVLNFVAIKLYRKVGFEFCDTDSYERVMAIKLTLPLHNPDPVGPFFKGSKGANGHGDVVEN